MPLEKLNFALIINGVSGNYSFAVDFWIGISHIFFMEMRILIDFMKVHPMIGILKESI